MGECLHPSREGAGWKNGWRAAPLGPPVRPVEGAVSAHALRKLRGNHITAPKRAGTAEGMPTAGWAPLSHPDLHITRDCSSSTQSLREHWPHPKPETTHSSCKNNIQSPPSQSSQSSEWMTTRTNNQMSFGKSCSGNALGTGPGWLAWVDEFSSLCTVGWRSRQAGDWHQLFSLQNSLLLVNSTSCVPSQPSQARLECPTAYWWSQGDSTSCNLKSPLQWGFHCPQNFPQTPWTSCPPP